jgi:hypothetical protein
MKGFVTDCVTALCVTSGLAVVGGCDCYRNLVDPCYPDRYEYAARQEVISSFAPQVQNGHFLDQTVWNYHFEPGTERLTKGGMEELVHLARRRPYPDCTIYLATAHDIDYDPAAPNKYQEQRANLDQRRIQAIQTYLAAETSGRNLSFEVVVHDPPETGLAAQAMGISVGKMYLSFQGSASAGAGVPGAVGGVQPPGISIAPGGAGSGGAGGAGGSGGSPPR